MKKTKDLAVRYNAVCNEYVVAFCNAYGIALDTSDIWVAGDVGTIACIGDLFLDFNSVIKYAVDNDLKDYDELLRWYDYTLFASEFNQTIPNFDSWCKGCPRLSEKEQENLKSLKKSLFDAIESCKNKTQGNHKNNK